MKYLLLTAFVLLDLFCSAQSSISGKITDGSGKEVANANLILYEQSDDNIVTYSISDDHGNYKIAYGQLRDSLRLEITCVGYTKLIKILPSGPALVFSPILSKSTTLLPEISVKPKPITVSNDTIRYNAKSFSDKGDRALIDVIRKLPGIKVTETGQILYNNKPINKFYVEGKDLLEGRYSIATNNLPSDIVDQIQVLRNHQPIKLLEGIEQSDKAALNITLMKDAKLRLIGSGHASAGLSPLASDDNLSLLKFAKEIQYINTVKYNSAGTNLDQEVGEQNFSASQLDGERLRQDLVSLVKSAVPPLDQTKYWFNNNTLASGNYLLGTGRLFEVKLNATFEHDQLKENSATVTRIFLPQDTVVIDERHRGERAYSKLQAGMTLQANTKQVFLKDALGFQRQWSEASDFISPSAINQRLSNPFTSLKNELSGIVNMHDNLVGINSFVNYTNLPQNLRVTPGQYADVLNAGQQFGALSQAIQLSSFFTDNTVSFSKKLGHFYLKSKIGGMAQFQAMRNSLSVENDGAAEELGGNYKNGANRKKVKVYEETALSYSTERVNVSVGLKASVNAVSNKSASLNQSADRAFANPNLSVLYRLSPSWETSLGFLASNSISAESNPSFVLQDYRTLANSDAPIRESSSKSLSYTLSYKDAIEAEYSTLSIQYNKGNANIINSISYIGVLMTRTALLQNNPYSNTTVSWDVSKYYVDAKTNVGVSLAYSASNSRQLQQSALSDFHGDTYTIDAKTNSKIGKNISLLYELNFSQYRNSSLFSGQRINYRPVNLLGQKVTLKYFLPRDVETDLSAQQYYSNSNVFKGANTYFLDCTVQKSISKPKLDFSMTLSNLLNVKSYINYSYVDNIFTSSQYALRGRMLMLRMGFQF